MTIIAARKKSDIVAYGGNMADLILIGVVLQPMVAGTKSAMV